MQILENSRVIITVKGNDVMSGGINKQKSDGKIGIVFSRDFSDCMDENNIYIYIG